MSDLGPARSFLGIEIEKEEDCFCISQQVYNDTILKRLGLLDAKPAKTPLDPQVNLNNPHYKDKSVDRKKYLSIVGSLTYATLGSQLDIAFRVIALSRYNVQPLAIHLKPHLISASTIDVYPTLNCQQWDIHILTGRQT